MAAVKQYVAQHGSVGQSFVAITCGANMNFDRLRFVAERAELGEQREALFGVTIPEERGSFRRFCEVLGQRSVTEFNYRISDPQVAHVFVGLSISSREEATEVGEAFRQHGFAAIDLSGDELAKEHLRHLVGGRSPLAASERLFRFVFPERPGALMRFWAPCIPIGTSVCFTTGTKAPTTGGSWWGYRCRPRKTRSSVASSRRWRIRMSRRRITRCIVCFCAELTNAV